MDFKFPDVGEGITEGEIVKWLVKEGDIVKSDGPLAEIETDKAVVTIPSPVSGKVQKIHHSAGDTIHVGEVLVTILESENSNSAKSSSVVGVLEEGEEVLTHDALKEKVDEIAVNATPATRRLAKELGVSLSSIAGSGKEGRITEEDVRSASAKPSALPALKIQRKYDLYGHVDHVPLKGVRKSIARNLTKSAFTAVHVTHMEEIDVTELVALRESDKKIAQSKNIHLTHMPYIIKAVIAALREHPYLSATLIEETEEIVVKKYFNIGVAVDTDDGLVVPVVKIADKKSIFDIAREITELSEKAHQRKLDIGDMKGGVFTITNVGSLGGIYATPIINPGECAILATGKITEKPVVRNSAIVARNIMPVSLTFDHRIIDGAEAARFVNVLKQQLENPEKIQKEAEADEEKEGALG